MSKSPYWQPVRTESGYHLVLMGGNEEPVLTSEVLIHPEDMERAVQLAREATEYRPLEDRRTK